MKDLLEQIESYLIQLEAVNQEIRDLRGNLALIEAEETFKIATEKDVETNKPLYPNDKLRDAALTQALALHAGYNSHADQLKEKEKSKVYLSAQIERLRGEFKLGLLDRQFQLARQIGNIPVLP